LQPKIQMMGWAVIKAWPHTLVCPHYTGERAAQAKGCQRARNRDWEIQALLADKR